MRGREEKTTTRNLRRPYRDVKVEVEVVVEDYYEGREQSFVRSER
jgi:hypothetical protein